MKLFLASALHTMKEQLLEKFGKDGLEDKKIAYIINPADHDVADAPEGENLWRLKNDREMLLSCGLILEKVDLRITRDRSLYELLEKLDGIYVSGGNTYYFRQLAAESGYDTILYTMLTTNGKFYLSTSAGSCVMGSTLKYIEPGGEAYQLFDGLEYVPSMILPHWGSDAFQEDYLSLMSQIYTHQQPIITLTDQQALWVTDTGIEIVTPLG